MSRKLLLADDSITIQKVVELVLSEEDFHIKAVSNGNDALSQVEVFNPDVVLADIEMPGMNGYQLCDKIKKNRATAHISVLLLAGAFEPLDEELAKNVGADDYIVKP
ncbi:MAG: response regulator, partial [Thermodesulfovibrionia bacterium]|nr:response regulator [Thermodesulfovibrionia bacterium]